MKLKLEHVVESNHFVRQTSCVRILTIYEEKVTHWLNAQVHKVASEERENQLMSPIMIQNAKTQSNLHAE